jgi:hypothetical protein
MTNPQVRASRIDLDELRAALIDQLETLSKALLGPHNLALSSKRQWRWGNKGSFVLEMSGAKRGVWHDKEADQGGGPIRMVHHRRGGTMAEAIAWSANFAGLSPAGGNREHDQQRRLDRERRLAAEEAAAAADRRRRAAYAQRVLAQVVPLMERSPITTWSRHGAFRGRVWVGPMRCASCRCALSGCARRALARN